jgi:hypothetical protein
VENLGDLGRHRRQEELEMSQDAGNRDLALHGLSPVYLPFKGAFPARPRRHRIGPH